MKNDLLKKLYSSKKIVLINLIDKYSKDLIKYSLDKNINMILDSMKEYIEENEPTIGFELFCDTIIDSEIIIDLSDCFIFYTIIQTLGINNDKYFVDIKFKNI